MVTNLEDINIPDLVTHLVRKNTTNSAQFEHGGGSPLVQVTRDAGGTLSNEEHFLREASLCREIFTVVWRYWNTLVVWFGWCAWAERRPSIFLRVLVTLLKRGRLSEVVLGLVLGLNHWQASKNYQFGFNTTGSTCVGCHTSQHHSLVALL
jgi:hypothetical protein